MDALNREFQRLLVSSGWSQARAASELRLDAATVSRYMSGTINPSETVLRLFGEILGERVVLGTETVPPSMKTGARHVEVYESQALDALRRMPAKARRQMCDVLVTMAAALDAREEEKPRDEVTQSTGRKLSEREANLIRRMRGEFVDDGDSPVVASDPEPSVPAPTGPRRRSRVH